MKTIIKQNRIFLSIALVLFIGFGFILFIGANLIYQKEADRQHENEVAHLHSAKLTITTFFSDISNDLSFFSSYFSGHSTYIESDLPLSICKTEDREMLSQFLQSHGQYNGLGIVDVSGREIARVDRRDDGNIVIVPDAELKDEKSDQGFQEALKMVRGQMYVSTIEFRDAQKPSKSFEVLPIIIMATPLIYSGNEMIGVLTAEIDFSKCLQNLPENMFIQTEDGNLASMDPSGKINYRRAGYHFDLSSDLLKISEKETFHYAVLEYPAGRTLVLAIDHQHPELESELQKLVWISFLILAVFLFLVLIISYINISRSRKVIEAEKAIIFSLIGLSEGRDPETGAHLIKTRKYPVLLSRQLSKSAKYKAIITSDFIENIYEAAPLHDIGKVGIPDAILLKESKLTEEEFEQMKKHVSIGERIIQQAIDKFKLDQPFLTMGRKICSFHHEKYNGTGYLNGLKGEEIPLEARIFTLCDAYDAIRSKRPYKDELSHEEAIKRIISDRGEHFDPDVVDAFLKCEKDFAETSRSLEQYK